MGAQGRLNSQLLSTGLGDVYDQVWGGAVHVTGGSFDATSISIDVSCVVAEQGSGSMTGTWNGFQFSGGYTFGTGPDGNFTIAPAWPLN
jgi:hypothetical protein